MGNEICIVGIDHGTDLLIQLQESTYLPILFDPGRCRSQFQIPVIPTQIRSSKVFQTQITQILISDSTSMLSNKDLCYQTRNLKNSTSEFQPTPFRVANLSPMVTSASGSRSQSKTRHHPGGMKMETQRKLAATKNTRLMYGRFINVPHRQIT